MTPTEARKALWLIDNVQYREKPFLTFSSFVDECLKMGEDIYPEVRKECDLIVKMYWEKGITEAIMNWGIGSGKSLGASIMTLYFLHILLCLKDPHGFYKLSNDKPLAVINMGTSATQAKNVVFTSIATMIGNSDWFKQFVFDLNGTEIRFFKEGRKDHKGRKLKPYLAAYCGNSKETTPLGYNIFAGICDEFAFYLDTDSKNIAMDIYDMLKNRITSRFGLAGFIMPISSSRYENDAIDTLYKKHIGKHGVDIYCSRRKSWEIKDPNKMQKETFDFVAEYEEDGKTPRETWHSIPIDYRKAFTDNPEKAMRDFGCRPSLALEPFDRDGQIVIRNCNLERENPLTPEGKFKEWFTCADKERRYAHIDLGLKKDACGIVVGRADGFDFVDGEKRPKVFVDLIMRIKAPENGEILFSEVRQVLYSLIDRGFNLKYVTFDGWQSADSIQILKTKGIEAEIQSVDRTTEPYDTLKALLHNNAINFYRYTVKNEKREDVNIFEKEYMSLELIKGKKVDHPENGSKDVADAMAGMVMNIVKRAKARPGLS